MQSIVSDALGYYREVAALIGASFEDVPLVWNSFPQSNEPPVWRGPLHVRRHKLPTIDVRMRDGTLRPYFKLQPTTMDWLAEYHHAVEFHSWTPVAEKPDTLHYARILLETDTLDRGPHPVSVHEAALRLRDILREDDLESIPLLDGNGGVAIYIPFSDAPSYSDVRAWLHEFANDAAARFPELFTTEPNSVGGSRVHVHVKSNAPGLYSALPYSLQGPDGRCVVAPVTWDELAGRDPQKLSCDVAELLERIQSLGDVFAGLRDRIGAQRFASARQAMVPQLLVPEPQPHGHVISAALEILGDGHSRSAEDILEEGIARKLLVPSTSDKYVYNALVNLIQRNVARGRKSPVVQNPDRTFRLNQPLDDWPDVHFPAASPNEAAPALVARLRAAVHGSAPVAWEAAVCDAFAHLGFRATHLGGVGAPDGYVDAQLGALGYRVMIECKTGKNVVTDPEAVEAAKWVDAYRADYSGLIGPAFSQEAQLVHELMTHKVSAWTVDDLVMAIDEQLDPLELSACFAPGFAQDALLDVLWERAHGQHKRIAYIAATVHEQGWEAQEAAAIQADPKNAAHLTIDAAMLLVQEELSRAGATRACTREEVQLAFQWLTSPMVAKAVWLDAEKSAIVVPFAQTGGDVKR